MATIKKQVYYSQARHRFLIFKLSAVTFLILLVWFIHILFLPHVVNLGMHIEDWEWLFYYDTFRGNFFGIKNNIDNIHAFQQSYYIGILRDIFGLNQVTFQVTTLLWKSLAALSVGFLVFKLTKDKLFLVLSVFFFIIFPSTAGLFVTVTGLNYLIVFFMSLSIYFYIQSIRNPKKILLASLFFFLALASGPARVYLLIPMPLLVELFRLKQNFRFFIFIRRMLIFYLLPYLFLRSHSATFFNPTEVVNLRLRQVLTGNLYTLTVPFQLISTLFIDQHVIQGVLDKGRLLMPLINPVASGFITVNACLFVLSVILGFIIRKDKAWFFVLQLMFLALLLEILFYLFGSLSTRYITYPVEGYYIPFFSYHNSYDMYQRLDSSIFQALIGAYIFILGLILSLEWWRRQRDNKILMVTVFAWIWSIVSIVGLYLTVTWWLMLKFSNDRYIFSSSVGAVVFTAGIFTLGFKALVKIQNLKLKLMAFVLTGFILLSLAYKEYLLLDKLYYEYSKNAPVVYPEETSYWQETMYQRFLNKFGKDNLKNPALILILINSSEDKSFSEAAFVNPIKYRIYYDENGNLIRRNETLIQKDEGMVRKDNCKVLVLVNDLEKLKKFYTNYNGEKGFVYDYTICVKPEISRDGLSATTGLYNIFYPLNNFYAYKIVNKEFVDIKDEIISGFDQDK